MFPAILGHTENGSDLVFYRLWECPQIVLTGADQKSGLSRGTGFAPVMDWPCENSLCSRKELHCHKNVTPVEENSGQNEEKRGK
jgi:hypothetical protein